MYSMIKCKSQYVGQTGREFKTRMKEHLGYIRNKKTSKPTGQHFNLPGHDISMFRASILEVCKSQSRVYREHREEHFIQAFQTKLRGMNRILTSFRRIKIALWRFLEILPKPEGRQNMELNLAELWPELELNFLWIQTRSWEFTCEGQEKGT